MKKQSFILWIIISTLGFSACDNKPDAQKIVDESIAFYGMDELNHKTLDFDFRKYHFLIQFNGGDYFYQRTFHDDSLGQVKDQLSNHGFVREVNGLVIPQNEKDSVKYAAAVNSVVYLALLPLKLNDPATHKKYLKSVKMKGKDYDEIAVSFDEEHGGEDHQDVFYFWFDQKDHSMDYFAYSQGGKRFRAVKNLINSGALKLQNYVNYKSKEGEQTTLSEYHQLYEDGKLEKLSEIVLEDLKLQ